MAMEVKMNTKNVRKERGAKETGGENTTRKQKTIEHGKYAAGVPSNLTDDAAEANVNATRKGGSRRDAQNFV